MKNHTRLIAGAVSILIALSVPTTAHASGDVSSAELKPYAVAGDDRRATLIDSKAEANDRLGSDALSAEFDIATDAELVAFLLLAKGPIADRNPDAVAAAEAQIPALTEITEAQALDASQQYVDASSVFVSEIRPGLLSSNPIYVQDAIDRFGRDFVSYVDSVSEGASESAEGLVVRASGCNGSFCVKQVALALTTAVVVWQIAGLHTVAAVTIVLAAAVFVYLPGNERMGQVDEQKFVSSFMSNIRA
ncbi:hypothetical protein [Cryobacterium lyxosi]|uniref:Sporulation delaying protein family toxin n=1 Tax=Cryobacterium lyxosi TaxID=1259228 RepID=A0A4R8ZDW2_9MICO|nr:hypothetical protein [Cryobacterium lyxosi]TFD23957.1 hypothetical protein E3T27_14335 [Cryobacterium lyxosi]